MNGRILVSSLVQLRRQARLGPMCAPPSWAGMADDLRAGTQRGKRPKFMLAPVGWCGTPFHTEG
eukprot:7208153-Pyramimonas_sp.AAC.2